MGAWNITAVGLFVLFGMAGASVQAAALQSGDLLSIDAGSWFGLDMDMNGQISPEEMMTIHAGADGGIGIGGDYGSQIIGSIDYWALFDKTGHHYTTIAPTGDTDVGLDFSGWSIFYDDAVIGVAVDYGAWTPGNCDFLGCAGVIFQSGVAAFDWSGAYGESYSLWYSWSFMDAALGAMIPTYYLLHVEGHVVQASISAVPLPPALWLLGSGLLTLIAGTWRRSTLRNEEFSKGGAGFVGVLASNH